MRRRQFLSVGGVLLAGFTAGCLSSGLDAVVTYEGKYASNIVTHVITMDGKHNAVGIYSKRPQYIAIIPPWVDVGSFVTWSLKDKRQYALRDNHGIWFIDNDRTIEEWALKIERVHDSSISDFRAYTIADSGEIRKGDFFLIVPLESDSVKEVGRVELV